MLPSVVAVTPQEDYILHVKFNNGEEGLLDIKPYLGFGAFKTLQDFKQFQRVHVSFDTIAWDCGLDLDPEFIYQKSNKNNNLISNSLHIESEKTH